MTASLDPAASVADLLARLEPVLTAAGWVPTPAPRTEAEIQQLLTGYLGAPAHPDVIAWCCFLERWAVRPNGELWPFVEICNWDGWFVQDTSVYFRGWVGESALRALTGDPEKLDCLQFGSYGDGLSTMVSPVTAGRGDPLVFEIDAESAGIFLSTHSANRPTFVSEIERLPTLRQWVQALVEAHVSGRLCFVEDERNPEWPPVVRLTDRTSELNSFPWPSTA